MSTVSAGPCKSSHMWIFKQATKIPSRRGGGHLAGWHWLTKRPGQHHHYNRKCLFFSFFFGKKWILRTFPCLCFGWQQHHHHHAWLFMIAFVYCLVWLLCEAFQTLLFVEWGCLLYNYVKNAPTSAAKDALLTYKNVNFLKSQSHSIGLFFLGQRQQQKRRKVGFRKEYGM